MFITVQTHIHADQPFEDPNGAVVPESCKHTTYCEEVINYPEEAISSLIETVSFVLNVTPLGEFMDYLFDKKYPISHNIKKKL